MSLEPITRVEKMLDAISKGKPTDLTPVTREEMFLAKASGASVTAPEPITRKEMFLSKIAGSAIETPQPVTREEMFLAKAGGADIVTPEPITRREIFLSGISAGGRYSEGLAYALSADGTAYTVSGIGTCADTEIIIPAEYDGLPVRAIGDEAFLGNASITSVIIPDSVATIGVSAFDTCFSLTSITIPDSVTSIRVQTFRECFSLTSVTVGAGVTSIGGYAFGYCTSIRVYDFTSHTSIPTLANVNAFTGIANDCEIRVPAALYDEWIAATNWSTYADHIVGIGVSEELPEEFQQVEYIESLGGAYIDTGYNLRKGLGYDITVQVTANQPGGVYGRWQSDVQCFMQYMSAEKVVIGYGQKNDASENYNVAELAFDKTNYKLANNDLYINGEHVKTFSDLIDGNSFLVLAQSSLRASGRCWGCKLYDYNNLVMDLVPCRRKSDNVAGMFDKVSRTFFANKGTGNFIIGTDAPAEQVLTEPEQAPTEIDETPAEPQEGAETGE